MSNGNQLPNPFPPFSPSGAGANVILVDDGSTSDINYDNPAASTITQTVVVTGLDDTNDALGDAIEAAIAAYPQPNYKPFGDCMSIIRIEPTIGIDGVRRQSMISARGATDDNGTTGTVASFRLVYGFTSHLGGATSYEFTGGGITYEENTLDPLESSGQIVVRVTGPTTSASAKAQAVAMFPTHPNNSSLTVLRSSVKYEGGATCATIWTVTLSYGCVKARAYGLVGNNVEKNYVNFLNSSGTLSVRERGQTSVDSAIDAAKAAYPQHPDLPGLLLAGWSGSVQENACDGLLTEVTLKYNSGGYNDSNGGTGEAGTLELAKYTTVIEQRETYIKFDLWTINPTLVPGTSYAMISNGLGGYEKRTMQVPIFRFIIPWNTATTLLTWAVTLAGATNSNSFSIGGRTWPPYTLRMNGVNETVVKDSTGTIKHINQIIIDACPIGFFTDIPDFMAGTSEVASSYVDKTFTVPTPASIP